MTRMDENTIKNTIRLDQHDKDIETIKDDVKELYKKTDVLVELSLSIKAMADNLKDVKEDVAKIKTNQSDMKDEISELRQLPQQTKSKIFDKVTIAVACAVGGGLLTYVLTNLFPAIFK